mmetsp:Transcript_18735/g.52701  ORF Transcript_18735/g.52701 Transcript_18735/m.52701 type:complete len:214 (+) Transcript_18735:100-741(+)
MGEGQVDMDNRKEGQKDRHQKAAPPKSRIYTRTGDHGTSALFNGERRSKTDVVFDALGHTDELNAQLGMAVEYCRREKNELADRLMEVQSRLLDVGAAIATPLHTSSDQKLKKVSFSADHTDVVESWINELDCQLEPLKNFILPGGGQASSQLHIARTICRRAERAICVLREEDEVEQSVMRYMNRLSDFLFVAARFAAHHGGHEETIYRNVK